MNDKNNLYTIRELTQDDWTLVKTIYQQGLDSNISTFQTLCPSYQEWNDGHLQDCRFVAVYEERVIGFAAISPTSKREVYHGVVEVSIYIDIQHVNKGIGTKLFRHLIKAAEENGYWSLYSSVIEENTASIALHQKCGFREIGFREKIARDRLGNWHNTILFERRNGFI